MLLPARELPLLKQGPGTPYRLKGRLRGFKMVDGDSRNDAAVGIPTRMLVRRPVGASDGGGGEFGGKFRLWFCVLQCRDSLDCLYVAHLVLLRRILMSARFGASSSAINQPIN